MSRKNRRKNDQPAGKAELGVTPRLNAVLPEKKWQWQWRNETLVVVLIAAVSAYLMLVNLDYAALWHDEGTNAIMAHSFVKNGTFSGWDGRNLFFGSTFVDRDQYAINNDFVLTSYPPWPGFPSALGIFLFGASEFGVRFFHALLGVLCLPLFYFLLRQNFPASARLRVLAFALFALSPIVILYMRQGRYYPDAIFFTLLCLYCYQRFWRGGSSAWLGGLAIVATLNFLNHFAIGFTVAASLALWHLCLHARTTSTKQWLQFAASGAVISVACGGYLLIAGIIGGDSAREYGENFYQATWLERRYLLLIYYFRDLTRTGWLSLGVVLWWAWYLLWPPLTSLLTSANKKKKLLKRARKTKSLIAIANADKNNNEDERERKTVHHFALFAVLLVTLSAMTSVQPPLVQPIADMRYMVIALPFVLFLSAVCVNWLWQKNGIAGGALLAVLMTTNFAAWPNTITGIHKSFGCPTTTLVLPALIREIHRPYPSAIAEAVAYLRANAAQDDTVFVDRWDDSAVLLYYLSDHLIFCCGLPDDAKLPRDKIRALNVPVYKSDATPQWWVAMNASAKVPAGYHAVYTGRAYPYPTQRPELEYRCFAPPLSTDRRAMRIYQRNEI